MTEHALSEHQQALARAISAIRQRDRATSGEYLVYALSQFSATEQSIYDNLQAQLVIEKLHPLGYSQVKTPEGIEWKWHSYTGRAENITQALADLLVQLISIVEAP